MKKILISLVCLLLIKNIVIPQENSIVNTSQSPYAKLQCVDLNSVTWTKGFWADWFNICQQSMVPHMMGNYMDEDISHSFANFEIAAGLKTGKHKGPPFHDGDFYKMFEAMIIVNSVNRDPVIDKQIDSIISIIAKTQREDGYIHSPVIIEERESGKKTEFEDRLNFETYNMGHLMTAACLHFRSTGKTNLLDVARKATDYLYNFYKRSSPELARNAICPSHYMGVIEMYRTTRDPKYLELATNLINIRGMVENGTDDNQDRIPFRQQTNAMGHAVRANYLYAGVADVYAETGDTSLWHSLDLIWNDIVSRKLYITGACGALYDGTSPDGTSYKPVEIQKIHQSYGRDYQLPNLTAHNESCANIGNILFNWRMFLATAEARFTDIMETVMYNSLLSAVSLDGKGYFYTNPLCVSSDITYTLRWSKEREEYISYCNCCPPNTIRTVAEIHNYMYSLSDKGLWVNFYGGNQLITTLKDGSDLKINQETNYPWDGKIVLSIEQCPEKEFSIFLRIPGWCNNAELTINGKKTENTIKRGSYFEMERQWKKGDKIILNLPMEAKLIEANPLVEENRNQVAIKRGPVVYCLEAFDITGNQNIFNISMPADIKLQPKSLEINGQTLVSLTGQAKIVKNDNWNNQLYREINKLTETTEIRLIPYYAWGNRGKADMTVWLPLDR